MAKKARIKIIDIDLPPFDYGVIGIVGGYERAMAYIKKITGENFENPAMALGRCVHIHDWRPFLWIPRFPKTPKEYGTLAHEASHAAMWLMDWTGSNATADNDEFFGHAVSHIVQTVLGKAHV